MAPHPLKHPFRLLRPVLRVSAPASPGASWPCSIARRMQDMESDSRIRHREALAGRRHRPCIPNEGLRYMRIGYARVSKADDSQSLDLQSDAGPGLDSCLRALRKGDVLVVWKLDRRGRNLAHRVHTVKDLSARLEPAGARQSRRADRHHHRSRPPRVRHLRSTGQVRTRTDP